MPSSVQISLHSIPSAPGTPTSFESTCESLPVGRGPKVLNGRLVKSKPRQPTQSTSSRTLPPSPMGSPSPLAEGKKDQRTGRDDYDDDNDNVHINGNNHVSATKEPQKHSKHSRDKEVKPEKPASGNKIWKLMKRISTGGLRDKYTLHSPSFSMSGPSGKAPVSRSVVDVAAAGGSGGSGGIGIGGPPRSLSRAAQLRVTKLSNYSEESLSLSHQSRGSYGSLVASSSHTSHASHGESCAGPALLASSASAFNTFNYDHEPPPVPAIPKDLQNLQAHHHLQTPNVLLPPAVVSSPSSPAFLSSSEPGSNMSRKHHRRDRDSRSASSPIPSIPSPLSPGQLSSVSYSSTNYSSSPPPHTPSPSPSAPSKKRILSRISSMGLLRRKPSIASGLAASLGFGAPATGTPEKTEKSGKNEKMKNSEAINTEAAAAQGELAVHEVPALFTIPTIPPIPSTPPDYASKVSKPKSTKYSISCIPVPSIPSMPSMSIIASSTPSTPTRSTTTAPISISSSSRPGTGKTTLSQSSSAASSPHLSLDSRSHSRSMGILAMQSGSQSVSRSRSSSLDSLDSLGRRRNHHDHNNHAHTTPTRNKTNNSNNNNNHNHNTVPTPVHSTTTTTTDIAINNNDYPYPLDKHIVPPLELSATFSGEDDNKWGVEHVLSGGDDAGAATSSTFVSLPAIGHNEQSGNGSLSYPSPHSSLGRRDGVSVDSGLGPKHIDRSLLLKDKLEDSNVMVGVNKREEKTVAVDKWERLSERVEKWDKSELDKLDGLRSRNSGGRESWSIARSPEQELPSLPVPPRKRTKEQESRREKEKESSREEMWQRSASVDIPASPVSSSPIYRGRAMDDIPAPSTFGRVMGKQIGAEEKRQSSSSSIQGRASFSVVGDDGRDSRKKNGRDGSRKRRSLSAVRSPSALIASSKDGQSNIALPSMHSWTKSLPSPIRDVATMVSTATSPAPAPVAATQPRALGTLFRKMSFSGISSSPASGTEKRRNKSPKRPSTASSISSRNMSISGGGKSGFFWNGGNSDSNKQGELESSSSLPQPRRLLRKNSLLKGRGHTGTQDKDSVQDKPPMATRMRRPRTADSSSSISNTNSTLTEKEKRARWESLLERSEKAGGTIHLRANGEGLLSDRMRMSMASTTSGVSGAQVGVQEGDC